MPGFRDLRVWRQAVELVEQVYRATERFPDRVMYGLAVPLRRAAVSVPSNLAEGHTRQYIKKYPNHLSVAQGSLAEMETQLEIAARLKFLPSDSQQTPLSLVTSLRKQIYPLRNSLCAAP